MRRYEGGVLVGEIDPPVGTLREHLESELKLARSKFDRAESLGDRTALTGRIGALHETLYQLKRREG